MLFRETVAVYCETHTEHTDKLCGGMRNFNMLSSNHGLNKFSDAGKQKQILYACWRSGKAYFYPNFLSKGKDIPVTGHGGSRVARG
jgi:hypothetical protein